MSPERWQQIKSVLDKALERSPRSRGEFLQVACSDDLELRREVESFLEFEAQEADFIEEPAFELVKELIDKKSENFIGKRFGHYKILEELGRGGMGAVFLAARDDGEFEQKAAIKLIKSGINSDTVLRRFHLERRILASLEHANIARLIDGGTTDDGLPFLVMEYVEGITITDYAAAKNLSSTERLDLFRQVCAAVSYAHAHLVVHRDLKPSNILVTKEGVPKLLDFGIAKILNSETIGGSETKTHNLAFTPEYASPEQLRGEPLTTATDIYSLGVILYELLTGARPFCFENKNFGEIIQTVSQNEPARPSSIGSSKFKVRGLGFDWKQNHPKSLKGDLDNIVLKALKKDLTRRYASVEQFSEDVRRHLRGLPVLARPDTLRYRAEKFVRRNPRVFAASAFAVLSLIGGIIAAGYQAQRAETERQVAQNRFNDVRQLAHSFVFEINDEIGKSPIRARELLVKRAIEYLDKLSAEAAGDDSLQIELAAAYDKIGDVQTELFNASLGDSAGALESHQKALNIRQKLFEAEPKNLETGVGVAQSLQQIGNILTVMGKSREAIENYRKSIEILKALLSIAPEDVDLRIRLSNLYATLGQAILRTGSLTETLENYNRALEIQEKLAAENPGETRFQNRISVFYIYIGYVLSEMGKPAEALEKYQEALAIETKIFETDKQNQQFQIGVMQGFYWVGTALRDLGRFDESLASFNKSLEIQQKIFDADRLNFGERNGLADCFLEIGVTLVKTRNAKTAVSNLQKAIANYEVVSQNDPQNASARRQISHTRHYLADALILNGEINKALEVLRQTQVSIKELTARDPNNSEWQQDLATNYLQTGEVLLKTGDHRQAAENFRAALPIFEKLIGESPENVRRQNALSIVKAHLSKLSN